MHLAPFRHGVLEQSSISIWQTGPVKPEKGTGGHRSQDYPTPAFTVTVTPEKRGAEFPDTQGSAKVKLFSPASDRDNWEERRAPEARVCFSSSVSSPHFSLLVKTGLNGYRGSTPTSEPSLRGTGTENERHHSVWQKTWRVFNNSSGEGEKRRSILWKN